MEAEDDVEPAESRATTPRPGARAAARAVRMAGAWATVPDRERAAAIGVVLGTGLGAVADAVEDQVAIAAVDTDWLCRSTATGHAGRIVCGTFAGVPIAILQGRVHGYEGFAPEALGRGVELLAALGATTLLLTNASGGLRPDMRAGEVVIVSDHLDLVRRPWAEAIGGGPSAVRSCTMRLYDEALAADAIASARLAGLPARRGVYAFLSGPSYETRSEYRMLRAAGADVVGMSTVPEVVVAHRLGLRVVVCSVVTNVARPDAPDRTDAEDVCHMAASGAATVTAILHALAQAHGLPRRTDGPPPA